MEDFYFREDVVEETIAVETMKEVIDSMHQRAEDYLHERRFDLKEVITHYEKRKNRLDKIERQS